MQTEHHTVPYTATLRQVQRQSLKNVAKNEKGVSSFPQRWVDQALYVCFSDDW
jgi:hypothetical protein